MTRPSVVKDLLIKLPSFKRSPRAPVLDTLSLPARSTKLILETFSVPLYITTHHNKASMLTLSENSADSLERQGQSGSV